MAENKVRNLMTMLCDEIEEICQEVDIRNERGQKKALENILKRFKPFGKHPLFVELLQEIDLPKAQTVKLSIDLVLENMVQRLIGNQAYLRDFEMVKNELMKIKCILREPLVSKAVLEYLSKSHASRLIQRRAKIYLRKKRRTAGKIDWSRMKAGIGKEYIQIFRQEAQEVLLAVSAAFKDN